MQCCQCSEALPENGNPARPMALQSAQGCNRSHETRQADSPVAPLPQPHCEKLKKARDLETFVELNFCSKHCIHDNQLTVLQRISMMGSHSSSLPGRCFR